MQNLVFAETATPDGLLKDMANAVRFLSMDAVEKAKSGHPGLPMGAADFATVLFSEFLKYDPKEPLWADRDRFVLSAGHGSMLLYSLLHLIGVKKISIDEIKKFRQMGSLTPGHPEWLHTPGVETTTGPLGQGLANAVGMALAEKIMAERFGTDLVCHRTYVLASDGDLMEGISQEALALAGHLKLAKLTVMFDMNNISIDGPLSLTDSTDQIKRFAASGWHTVEIDGHNYAEIRQALRFANTSDRPTLIACKTTIGYGAQEKAGKSSSHGSPLGAEEIAAARKNLNWPHEPFVVPEHVYEAWQAPAARGAISHTKWQSRFGKLSKKEQQEFLSSINHEKQKALWEALDTVKQSLASNDKPIATRASSGTVLEAAIAAEPTLISGSADLSGSNGTMPKGISILDAKNFGGRYIHWGIREHAMASAMNGMLLHGGVHPLSGTFLVFADYMRPALRLAALMGLPAIHVLSHDSIGVGEDGPTHQPVEHLSALRAIPNLLVMRPADAVEVAECWQIAFKQKNRPTMMVLTRQNLPLLRKNANATNESAKGGYVLLENEKAQVTLMASGSEVSLCIEAVEKLAKIKIAARVISMPCMELFAEQDKAYQQSVLGTAKVRIGVEAAIAQSWERWLGDNGEFVGMSGFGASAPYTDLYEHFSITSDAICTLAQTKIKG